MQLFANYSHYKLYIDGNNANFVYFEKNRMVNYTDIRGHWFLGNTRMRQLREYCRWFSLFIFRRHYWKNSVSGQFSYLFTLTFIHSHLLGYIKKNETKSPGPSCLFLKPIFACHRIDSLWRAMNYTCLVSALISSSVGSSARIRRTFSSCCILLGTSFGVSKDLILCKIVASFEFAKQL